MIQAVLRYYAPMRDHTPWHRLFGIALTDLFAGRPWRVELEKELALKSQRLELPDMAYTLDDFKRDTYRNRRADRTRSANRPASLT